MPTQRQSVSLLRKLASLALLLTTSPALAERWPGVEISPYGAITARTIGVMCSGALKSEELYDLDLYLSRKRLASVKADGTGARQEWLGYVTLEQAVMTSYRDPVQCSADAEELARDMVGRVRRELIGTCAQDGCFDP
jgi:hypothetical protein